MASKSEKPKKPRAKRSGKKPAASNSSEQPEEKEEVTPRTPSDDNEDDGAQVDIRMRGRAPAVRRAARRIAGDEVNEPDLEDLEEEEIEAELEEEEPEEEIEDPEDPLDRKAMKLLNDGRFIAVVSRTLPEEYAKPLAEYELPMPFEQIRNNTFKKYGGEWFRLSFHPNTPTGRQRTVHAIAFKNPKTDIPTEALEEGDDDTMEFGPHGGGRMRNERQMPMVAGDPYAREDDSTFARMKRSIQQKTEMLTQKMELESAKEELADLQRQIEERSGGRRGSGVTREDMERQELQRKLEATEREIANLKNGLAQGAGGNQNDLLLAVMESSSKQFNALMTMINNSNTNMMQMLAGNQGGGKKEDNLDDMLDRLTKLKSVFGENDTKVKRFEQMMYDAAMAKFEAGDSASASDDEDTIKYGLKQLTPVLKTYVERKLDQEARTKGGPPPSEEDRKNMYDQAAKKAATDLANQLRKDGLTVAKGPDGKLHLVPLKKGKPAPQQIAHKPAAKKPPAQGGAPAQKPAAKTPPPDPEGDQVQEIIVEPMDLTGKPSSSPPPPAPAPDAPEEETPETEEVPEPVSEETDVDTPPAPGEAGYDRKKALDFILDIAITDATEGCPEDTFLVGDILDRLDGDLLEDFLLVGSGEELESWLAPHATPEKIERLKELGADPEVKNWISRVIVTAQNAYRQSKGSSADATK